MHLLNTVGRHSVEVVDVLDELASLFLYYSVDWSVGVGIFHVSPRFHPTDVGILL